MAIKWVSEQRVLDALRAWRKAANRGYGERDHSYSHMQKVDARIRKLKEKYEALVAQKKSQPKSSVLANPRGRSISCRVIPNGKGGYRVFVTAKEAARLRVGNPSDKKMIDQAEKLVRRLRQSPKLFAEGDTAKIDRILEKAKVRASRRGHYDARWVQAQTLRSAE